MSDQPTGLRARFNSAARRVGEIDRLQVIGALLVLLVATKFYATHRQHQLRQERDTLIGAYVAAAARPCPEDASQACVTLGEVTLRGKPGTLAALAGDVPGALHDIKNAPRPRL